MIVYKATNTVNGKIYIGITIHTLELRSRQHINEAHIARNNMLICKAIRKYGADSFIWEVIFEGDNRDELQEKEKYYIALYDSYKNGYNMTIGGEGIVGVPITDEARKKKSESMKGENNPWYGKSGINSGRIFSDEHKKKLSESAKKRKMKPMTEEHKEKIRNANQGESGSGAKLTEQYVLEIRELYSSGNYTYKDLADMYGVKNRRTIQSVVHRKTWRHI